MRNVEFKSELRDQTLAADILRRLGASFIARIEQRDTYFRVPDCRLKKREARVGEHAEPVEYIHYERPDEARARISRFSILSEPEAIARFGVHPLPIRAIVEKTRDLWMIEAVRIHLDDLHALGRFFEIEALVTPKQNVARGHARVAELRRALSPALGEPLSVSYCDLVESAGAPERDTTAF